VGCGAGDNAAILRSRGCVVDGITFSPDEAAVAGSLMRSCWVADLEAGFPPEALERRYDCVLLSHILEHLRHPEALVQQALGLLVDGGALLIAVPNVLNWRQRFEFVSGRFDYQESGVLDRKNLRFFTFESVIGLLFARAPEACIEYKSVSGSVPLWILRRHVLPAAISARIDAFGKRLVPGLFGSQILIRARAPTTARYDSAPEGPRAAPTISACLLTYNHAHVLAETVRSILAQDFEDFELVLSDDCSTDGTWELAQELARTDPRVRAERTPENRGMAGNANYAVSLVRGPFVALLHHDDIYASCLFRRWLAVLEADPSIGFVSNGYANHGSDLKHISPLPTRSDGVAILEDMLSRWDSPFRGTALIRRACWEAIGGMREQFGLIADVDMWMRLSARYAVGYIQDPLITVRQERPDDYPDEYLRWSWRRQRLLYEIHGANYAAHFGEHGLRALAANVKLRTRVSGSTAFWLAYAVAKRRWDMLTSSAEVANDLEFRAVAWARQGLAAIAGLALVRQ